MSTHRTVVDIANAGDGSGRLFLVRQSGSIHINLAGEDLATPFLNISGRVMDLNQEQGLLSVAFPADYEVSGCFYVWYTGLGGGMMLSRFRVSEDPNVADPNSEQILLIVPQPFDSHNGGRLQFGPDGMLYLGLGDGGGACDQAGLTLPVAEYDHDLGCSITGGEVYRGGAYPGMQGLYFFGDFCTGRVWGLSRDGDTWTSTLLADTPHNILTFGLGEDGSVYMASQAGGILLLSDGEPVPEGFRINPGLNDAWYNPLTNGQGFLIVAFPGSAAGTQTVFLAWFTYDVERPPGDVTAMLGEPGHRWLTAQGTYVGDTATLDIYLSSGGVFDSPAPAVGAPSKEGTMTVTWSDCESALVTYDIPSLGLAGEIPIERIVPDNVALCEALQ